MAGRVRAPVCNSPSRSNPIMSLFAAPRHETSGQRIPLGLDELLVLRRSCQVASAYMRPPIPRTPHPPGTDLRIGFLRPNLLSRTAAFCEPIKACDPHVARFIPIAPCCHRRSGGLMFGITGTEVEGYCIEQAPDEDEVLKALVIETKQKTTLPQMQVGRLEGGFLRMLVRLVHAQRVVEVGTFTGYSALAMAAGLPDNGKLITCDIDPETTAIARAAWDRSPHGKKIELRLGDASETLTHIEGPIDLAFIDADKTGYASYWDLLLPKMRKGGLIVADNTLWSGRALDPGDDPDSRAIAEFNEMVRTDPRTESVLLPVRDGMLLAYKL